MANIQNLVLTDRASPVVNHTFTPRDVVDGVGTVEESTGVKVGDKLFSISMKRTPTGKYKGRSKLTVPVVVNEVINGVSVPAVARTSIIEVTLTFDKESTEQERKDAIGMFQSSFDPAKVLVNDTFVKLTGVY